MGWDLSGDGEHDYLWIEKTNTNTEWLAGQLAQYADVPAKDVGYAGMKDRRAVTRQWFSVPRWNKPDWNECELEGVRLIDVKRHLRKLRRGAHRGNTFRIVLRSENYPDPDALYERLETIKKRGVPNYFGEQRFGHNGDNLRLAESWANGKRLARHKRSIAVSTVRSFAFNEALAERVKHNSWDQLICGDLANLDGSGSIFDVVDLDDELRSRCSQLDIHPAGRLAGDGSDIQPAAWQKALSRSRVAVGSRSYRLRLQDLRCELTENGHVLCFTLGRGAFATSVLRELCALAP